MVNKFPQAIDAIAEIGCFWIDVNVLDFIEIDHFGIASRITLTPLALVEISMPLNLNGIDCFSPPAPGFWFNSLGATL